MKNTVFALKIGWLSIAVGGALMLTGCEISPEEHNAAVSVPSVRFEAIADVSGLRNSSVNSLTMGDARI